MSQVDFSWSPTSGFVNFSLAGNSYPPAGAHFAAPTTPVFTLLTFTAQVTPRLGRSITRYEWDFGDGTVGYGPVVKHSYDYNWVTPNTEMISPETQVTLTITDSKGEKASATHVLNLVS